MRTVFHFLANQVHSNEINYPYTYYYMNFKIKNLILYRGYAKMKYMTLLC